MVRFNPGLMLLKNGVIINKWTAMDMPTVETLNKSIDELEYSRISDKKSQDRTNFNYICMIFFLPLLGLKGFDLIFFRKRKNRD